MAGGKETPRQKMIGMMYLVLMAMLAMNVSKEVLNAFIVINGAMEKTNQALAGQNASTMSEFKKQHSLDPDKVGQWLDKAKTVEKAGAETVEHIEKLKKVLIAFTDNKNKNFDEGIERYKQSKLDDGIDPDSVWSLRELDGKDNYDQATHILVGSEPSNPKEGEWTAVELKHKMMDFEETIKSVLPKKDAEAFDAGFDFGPVRVSRIETQRWEAGHFYHVPIAAVITNLTRYQANVRKAENDALKILMSNISAQDFKFDTIDVKVIPNSNYVVVGDSFKADVIVAAYSTTDNPILEVGSDIDTSGTMDEWSVVNPEADEDRVKVDNGVASYGFKVTSEGEVEWGGFIKIRRPGTDQYEKYPFRHKFIAAKPSVVVSPTKMNVVYRGLENPIDISVAGFSASQVKATTSNGSLVQKGPGRYMLKPGQGNLCKVSVSVETEDGTRQMGEPYEFRVKPLPKPEPKYVAHLGSGTTTMNRATLRANDKVRAELPDFDFDGVNYRVVEFTLMTFRDGRPVRRQQKGDSFSPQQKSLINGLGRGDQITIENIWAVGPDGRRQNLGNITIDVK